MKAKYLIFYVFILSIITSCKKNDEQPAPEVLTAPVSMHIHTYLDTYEVDAYDIAGVPIIYTTTEGRKISLTCSQLYVSDIELIKLDGSSYPMKDTVLLVNIKNQLYNIGNAPVGNYKSIRFKVGLNPVINNSLPSNKNYFLNDSKMWFNNQAVANEYVFVHCAGKIDTTKNASGTEAEMQPFVYKMGTNAHYANVQLSEKNYSVSLNVKNYIHLYADYTKLYNGIDLTKVENLSVSSVADNSKNVASKIFANMSLLFEYE